MKIIKTELEQTIKEEVQKFVKEHGYSGGAYGTRPRHVPKQHVKSAALHDAPEERDARAELEYLQNHYDYLYKTYGPEDPMAQETRKKIDALLQSLESTVDPMGRGVYEADNPVFAPNHYCAHHVAERKTWKKGTVVSHNWNETLKEVTKYNVDFGEGDVRKVHVKDLYILEAHTAADHPGHSADCDDDEEESTVVVVKENKMKRNDLTNVIREEIKKAMNEGFFDMFKKKKEAPPAETAEEFDSDAEVRKFIEDVENFYKPLAAKFPPRKETKWCETDLCNKARARQYRWEQSYLDTLGLYREYAQAYDEGGPEGAKTWAEKKRKEGWGHGVRDDGTLFVSELGDDDVQYIVRDWKYAMKEYEAEKAKGSSRSSRSGDSRVHTAPGGWARKSSLDWDQDISRFEESKTRKRPRRKR